MVVGILFGVIVWGCIWGYAVTVIIENKGYDENWFWWGFFFGIIALIVALTKPTNTTTYYSGGNTHLSRLVSDGGGNNNSNKSVQIDGWKCSKCGRVNYEYVGTCACGNDKLNNSAYIKRTTTVNNSQSNSFSIADEITKFKKLYDDGIISQEEFERKKKELLN